MNTAEEPQKPDIKRKPKLVSKVRRGHIEDLVDHYWGSINYISGLIRASEIKAGLILSFYGILFNFIYKGMSIVLSQVSGNVVYTVLIALWGAITVTSVYFCLRCFIPRIEGKFEKNAFFFGDVITKYGDIKEFSKTFYQISLDEEELFFQLGEQVYINAKIAALKFKYVNRAIRLLALGLFLFFVLSVLFVALAPA